MRRDVAAGGKGLPPAEKYHRPVKVLPQADDSLCEEWHLLQAFVLRVKEVNASGDAFDVPDSLFDATGSHCDRSFKKRK